MKKPTVEEVKEYAMEHYFKGGDVIVEAWDDEEIEEVIRDEDNPMEVFKEIMKILHERQKAAESHADNNPLKGE